MKKTKNSMEINKEGDTKENQMKDTTEINIITEIKDTDNKKDPHSNSEVTNLTPVTCKKLPMKCNIKKMYTFKSKHLF